MAIGQGMYFAVYINGQLPTAEQAAQITWNSNGVPGMERTEGAGVLGPQSPLGSWVIDANGAANTAVGTHTLTATYIGVTASFTFTRLPDNLPTVTPFPTATPTPTPTPTPTRTPTPTPTPSPTVIR